MNVITLETFATSMPRWEPNLGNHRYALVDMGSNGIRFSISDLSPPGARLLRCLYRERAAISLFDALNASASSGSLLFPSEIITQVSKTLARFKSIADQYGVPPEHVSVFATEAMRKADNAALMLKSILNESGLGLQVLAPEVETLFGAMGARSGFTNVNGLFLDLGGGSVQMTYMDSSMDHYAIDAARHGKSLPFGAAKLLNVLEKGEEQIRATAVGDLRAGMRDAFSRLQQEFPSLRDIQTGSSGRGLDVYLCGGGFRGYGSILMHMDSIQPYPIPSIGAYTVNYSLFKQVEAARHMNAQYDGKIFGMSKRRRRQFPAIATVVEALLDVAPQINTATFCSGGNREGALLMKLPKDSREANPLPLLHAGGDEEMQIFESIASVLRCAIPVNADLISMPTIFTLGLEHLFASELWTGIGEPSEANAAFAVHQSITRDPSAPGLTHLARSVLALTLCFRWGARLGAVDKQLYASLHRLVQGANKKASFWAEYIGTVASLLATVCPRRPDSPAKLADIVRFDARLKTGGDRVKLQLFVMLSSSAYHGVDLEDIESSFKGLGKLEEDDQESRLRVQVKIQQL
ncbi:Ppx/GppA phosphatase [Xylariaceae sp. FL0804]|nr:Ppx/GppA phosphatase [Xylariaceae sp. FL0804]